MGFSTIVKGNHSHMVLNDTPLHADTRKQTALAQVPERTVVQIQPSLQPSHLTVSSFEQHERQKRTYGRTSYITYFTSESWKKKCHKHGS